MRRPDWNFGLLRDPHHPGDSVVQLNESPSPEGLFSIALTD
jgi:hypothetical protein